MLFRHRHQILGRIHRGHILVLLQLAGELLMLCPQPRRGGSGHAVHLHRGGRGQIGLAGRGNQERAIGKAGEEHREEGAVRLGCLVPDAPMQPRKVFPGFMAVGGPIDHGLGAGVVNAMIHGVNEAKAGEILCQRSKAGHHIRVQFRHHKGQGGLGIGIVRSAGDFGARPFVDPRDENQGGRMPPPQFPVADP